MGDEEPGEKGAMASIRVYRDEEWSRNTRIG